MINSLNPRIIIPHRTKQQTRAIIHKNDFDRQMIKVGILQYFFRTIHVTTSPVILLRTTSVSIISRQTYSHDIARFVADYKVYRTGWIRIIRKHR